MVLARTAFAAAAALFTAAQLVSAEDVLYSLRLAKRQDDNSGNFNISFFHINDVHAHLDEFAASGTDCTRPERGCFGGYARVKHTIDEQRPLTENSLFLNVGDEFQGTLFYTYYGGEKIAETLNQMGFDAMTLGNHEFDGGDDELGAFLDNLTFPIISANIQSTHPILNRTIQPYTIFEDYNLAVIGVTTETTPNIANVGDGTTFSPAIQAVQDTIDFIRSTTDINRIAAITHIGYEEDIRLAEESSGLFLIMGGHSHTLLLPADDPNRESAEGDYPTIRTNRDGDEVFVVTARRWGEYLGYIDVEYNPDGKIVSYRGGPIHLTNTTEQDEDLQRQIDEWRVPFEAFAAEEVGSTNVVLQQDNCQREECTLGDFMADAMLAYRQNASDSVDFAIINAGGIRATIDEGTITRGEVLTSFPFGNSIVEITLTGEQVWSLLEGIVSRVNQENQRPVTSFFQVSRGIQVNYNPDAANGTKLVSVNIGDAPIDLATEYSVVTLDFLAGGGDNFFVAIDEIISLDTQDTVLTQYIQAQSPVNIQVEGRINQVNGTGGGNSTTPGGNSTVPSSTPSGTGAPPPANTNAGATFAVSMSTALVGALVSAGFALLG